MFFTKPITPPIIREEFDASKYRGVDKADIKAIHLALQNSEKLTIDRYGHIYTADGRWIADGMQRVKCKSKSNTLRNSHIKH